MKLQLESQHLRFRISEAELAYLLDGLALCDETRLDEIHRQQRRLRLYEGQTAELDWRGAELELRLPRAPVLDYVQRLTFQIGQGEAALTVEFEVDVRDSVRARLPRKARPA
jgi:hypothetical protein